MSEPFPSIEPGRPSDFRWQAFFQRATDPLFLLSRRRRILFVNEAWQLLTGVSNSEARGLFCRASKNTGDADPLEAIGSALFPPPEVMNGASGRFQRHLVVATGDSCLCDVQFLPIQGTDGLQCVLGKITAPKSKHAAPPLELPDNLLALRETIARRHELDQPPAELPVSRRLSDQIQLAAQIAAPVSLIGESGTGKHWLARNIHYQSAARDHGFAAIHCPLFPTAVLSDLLFGSGGVLRDRAMGTVYLSQVAFLPRDIQERLLAKMRNAERGAPRLIAGFYAEPSAAVRHGQLMEELACALGILTINVPPLRERFKQLDWFVQSMLQRLNTDRKVKITLLSDPAWDILRSHNWPGNLRELFAVLAEAAARSTGESIDPHDLPAYLRLTSALVPPTSDRLLPLDQMLQNVERKLILLALKRARGNKSRAAAALSIWRARLLRRMEILGINDGLVNESEPETLGGGSKPECDLHNSNDANVDPSEG